MDDILARREADRFASSFGLIEIHLDDPGWNRGFEPLVELWQGLHKPNGMPPALADIDFLEVPNLVPRIQTYRLIEEGGETDVITVFQGSEVIQFTSDETGKLQVADGILPPEMIDDWLKYVGFVRIWPFPHWAVANVMRHRLGDVHREESVVLPCSSDGLRLDEVLAGNYFLKVNEKLTPPG